MFQATGKQSSYRASTWLVLLAVLVTFLCSGVALAEDPPSPDEVQAKSRVSSLLKGFESVPTQAEWLALGPGTAEVLLEIANDTSERDMIRARAIIALGYFPSDHSTETLKILLASETNSEFLRRKAVRALATSLGDASLTTIAPYVEHKSVHMRESAIRAVASVKSPQAKALLESRLKIEESTLLREVLQDSIQVSAP